MENLQGTPVLTDGEISWLEQYRGRMITGVVYHTWVNATRATDVIRVLDALEIQFAHMGSLILRNPEEGLPGVRPVQFDVNAEAGRIAIQFGPAIRYESHAEERNALWEPLIGGILEEWLTYTNDEGAVLADELILRSGNDYVQVKAADDGLEVFPWEPDEPA